MAQRCMERKREQLKHQLQENAEKVICLLGINQDKITMHADIRNDLGLSESDVFIFWLSIEYQFSVVIPERAKEKLCTIDSIVRYLLSLR